MAGVYKSDVLNLLHSATELVYEQNLENAARNWDESFLNYYTTHLEKSVKISSRPNLEKLGIYNQISGITNNPAESANASFKRVTNLKNSSFFQVLSAWYLYQVDSLLDILRGIRKEGDFILVDYVPSGVYVPENICDVVDRSVISTLVQDGKIPPDIFSNQPYSTPSLAEATTLRGFAKMIIEKERITWLPKQSSFVVTGINKKQYLVSSDDLDQHVRC